MQKKPYEPHTLAEPQLALRAYLDDLLGVETLIAEPPPVIANAALAKELERATTQTAVAEVKAVVVAEVPVIETPVVETPVVETSIVETTPIELPAEPVIVESKPTAPVEHDLPPSQARIEPPEWAQQPFQCLTFQVAGVTLAAPLEKLNGIVEVDEEITELPGYAPWVIGLLPNRGKNVQVVDVAKVIMPNAGDQVWTPIAERMKFIILLDEGRFGLATDSLSQVLTLKADTVRWRGENSKRPWLAGTVVEKMCALLEVDLLVEQLRAGLKGG